LRDEYSITKSVKMNNIGILIVTKVEENGLIGAADY
jgi:hypothetical protein